MSIVECKNCGKKVHLTEAKSYGLPTAEECLMLYFCSTDCAIHYLFKIASQDIDEKEGFNEFLRHVESFR
jgi:hypothetical protein